jgi:hypothetical protein
MSRAKDTSAGKRQKKGATLVCLAHPFLTRL